MDDHIAARLSTLLRDLRDLLPDDLAVAVVRALADARPADAAQALAFGLRLLRIAPRGRELAQLEECLAALGLDATPFADAAVDDGVREPAFWFDPQEGPYPEEHDPAVVDVVAGDGTLGVWRAWRRPLTPASWPPSRPVYLVELADGETLAATARRLFGPDAAEPAPTDPLVELYVTGDDLPPLHRLVQTAGVLVHVARPIPRFEFADLFEGRPGPDGLPQDVVHLGLEEARLLLDRLDAGRTIVTFDHDGDDFFAPERRRVVPRHLRTDGRWIWSDASAYYLEQYQIAPIPALCKHLGDHVPGAVPDAVAQLGLEWLRQGGIA